MKQLRVLVLGVLMPLPAVVVTSWVAPFAAATTVVACGEVITHDLVLQNDLSDCPADGLVVGADAITIDLNGHTVDGVPTDGQSQHDGIQVVGHLRVAVRNGTVTQFGTGIEVMGSRNVKVEKVEVRSSAVGVLVAGSSAVSVVRTAVSGGTDGIDLRGARSSRLVANVVAGNGAVGILVDRTGDNVVLDSNTANRNQGGGIRVDSTAARLTKNRANFNGNLGIAAVAGVVDGGGNTAEGNADPAQCVGVRCNQPATVGGLLDPRFGTGGKVSGPFNGFGEAVSIQPDDKIIVAGTSPAPDGSGDFGLVRYNPDGSPDTTFGAGGRVATDFAAGSNDHASAVAIQPDGKVIAAGFSQDVTQTNVDFALARYNLDGGLDTTFGIGGTVTTNFAGGLDNDGATGVMVQPDGKIVAVGSTSGSASTRDFALARYNPDGGLDASFGSGGKSTTDFAGGSDDMAYAMVLQPDGRIVVAGTSQDPTQAYEFALARYNSNGALDTTFGSGGKVTTDVAGGDDQAAAMVLDPLGRIVVAGTTALIPGHLSGDYGVVRYNPDGSIDTAFGTGGRVTTDFAGNGDAGTGVILQPDGRIVVAGFISYVSGGGDFGLVRYDPSGSLDPTFGVGGVVSTDFAGNFDAAKGVAQQSGGRIVVAGTTLNPAATSIRFALAGYLP